MRTALKSAGVFLVLFAVAVALFHGRKSSGDAADARRLEIYFMYGQGETQQAWFAGAVERFKSVYPDVDIDVSYPGREVLGKLRPRLIIGNPPDMANQSSDELRPLLECKQIEPLDAYLEEKAYGQDCAWKDTFLPGILDAYKYEGHSYMVPQGLFAYGFFYNVDQFQKLGLAVPTTWAEMLHVCEVLKANGIEPVAADGTVREYNALWYPHLITRTTTLEHILATARGEKGTSWNEPCFVEAAKVMRDFTTNGDVMRGYQASAWPSAQMQWIQGKCAMLLCATWIPKEMKEKLPPGYHIGFFPFPALDDRPGVDSRAISMEIEAFSIPKDAKHKRLAIDFLKFITSPDEAKRVVALDIATAVKGAGMPPALEGLDKYIAPPNKICRLSANLGIEANDWYRTVARETWSQYFLGDYTPEEMCKMLDDGTKRYYALREKLPEKESKK